MVICPPAVRGDDRLSFAEQRFGLLAVTGGGDAKDGGPIGKGAPEEPRLPCLLPAGLIDAEDRGAANRVAEPFLRLAQGDALAPEDGVDTADRDLGTEELAAEIGHLAAGEPKARGEGGDGSLKAGAEALAGDLWRQLGLSERAAIGAAAAAEAVLGHCDRGLGQLGDLVAADRASRRPIGERVPTLRAALGQVLDHLIDLLDRQEPAT